MAAKSAVSKVKPQNLIHSENGCGGILELVSGGMVPAGSEGGRFYLYKCKKCNNWVTIGGK